jgi:ABC-type phosphate transport system auxiliary subunit
MYNEKEPNSRLPPLQNRGPAPRPKRSAQSQQRLKETPKVPKQNLTKDIDNRVESSLAQMFKEEVIELNAKIDRMELEQSKYMFEYNIMKKDYDNLAFDNEELKNQNESLTEKLYELDERKR